MTGSTYCLEMWLQILRCQSDVARGNVNGMKTTIPLLLCAALCGCASYSHTRTSPDGTKEQTSITSSGSKTALNGLKFTSTDTGGYTRNISLGRFGSDVSAELAPLVEAIAAGVAKGMAAQGGAPK